MKRIILQLRLCSLVSMLLFLVTLSACERRHEPDLPLLLMGRTFYDVTDPVFTEEELHVLQRVMTFSGIEDLQTVRVSIDGSDGGSEDAKWLVYMLREGNTPDPSKSMEIVLVEDGRITPLKVEDFARNVSLTPPSPHR